MKPYLEIRKTFRNDVGPHLAVIEHISVFVEISHRTSSVSFVVSSIDLFRGEPQSGHHRLCRSDHGRKRISPFRQEKLLVVERESKSIRYSATALL